MGKGDRQSVHCTKRAPTASSRESVQGKHTPGRALFENTPIDYGGALLKQEILHG
jgi:hypothetical protein